MARLNFMDWLAGALVTIGGINWGLIGFFQYDLLANWLGDGSGIYRVLTAIVGLAAVYLIGDVVVRATTYDESHVHA